MTEPAKPTSERGTNAIGSAPPAQTPHAWFGRPWRRMKEVIVVVFSFRRRGFDIPIALATLFTIFPVLLLFQQNQLIRDQGRISDQQRQIMNTQNDISRQQTELVKLQSLAEQSNMYRQLQLDINGVVGVIGDVSTAAAAYDDARDETVPLNARILVNGSSKSFDLNLEARGFNLSLCSERYRPYLPSPPSLHDCENSEPFVSLANTKDFVFRDDDYARVALALVAYLGAIGQATTID
jgi:hypothetical protein